MSISELLGKLNRVKLSGEGYTAQCPAHNDKRNSLSVTERDGRILLYCHAGCDFEKIRSALQVDRNELSPEQKIKKRIDAIYQYHDEAGEVLYEVVRFHPKSFSQRKPNGKGGYEYKLNGIRRVLFGLRELLNSDKKRAVLIVEGEKDCYKLRSLGLIATTNAGGAGKWRPEYSESLRGRTCYIIADNDEAGRRHAIKVAHSSYGIAQEIKVVYLPGLPDKGDVSDFLKTHSVDELKDIIKSTPPWSPSGEESNNTNQLNIEITQTSPDAPTESEDENQTVQILPIIHELNDLGNSRRFVYQHGVDCRYCAEQKKWYVYNGKRWHLDSTLEVERRAKQTACSIVAEANLTEDDNLRNRILKHAHKTKHARVIKDMLKMSESSLAISASDFDTDKWLLNCINGTLDLRTGDLRQHNRQDFITKLVKAEYDPSAKCPTFMAFLNRIMGSNNRLISFLRRALGYSLTGQVTERAVFILYGSGANGKTVLSETILELLGNYGCVSPRSAVLKKQNSSQTNDIAKLHNARFVSVNETEENGRLDESAIKDMSGGDTITARFHYAEFFDFIPQFKLWIRTNHKPNIQGTDDGIWDRLKLIPFTVRIPEHERDKNLKEKLFAEFPGILAWAVEGCLEWQQKRIDPPDEVEMATTEYRLEQNTFSNFINEVCVLDKNAWASTSELRNEYEIYCKERGEIPDLIGNAFIERIKSLGCSPQKRSNKRGWSGIGLIKPEFKF
ncbi:MAG TPA: phage/plasmid primase, P4 family [Pyrinomonadaceae bacterium]